MEARVLYSMNKNLEIHLYPSYAIYATKGKNEDENFMDSKLVTTKICILKNYL